MSQDDRSVHFGLVKLNEAGLTVADPADDIRGRSVVDCDGERIGHVSDLYVDDHNRVQLVEVRAGGFLGIGDRHFVLPIEAVAGVAADEVRVDRTVEHIIASPAYDPLLVHAHTRESLQETYDHFGVSPSWSTGRSSPDSPTQQF